MCLYRWIISAAGGRGASVSACAGLTNQLLSCWVDPRIAWKKHWHSNCRRPVDGGGGTKRPLLLTGAKKSYLECLIRFELPMGFQNFAVINKILPIKNYVFVGITLLTYFFKERVNFINDNEIMKAIGSSNFRTCRDNYLAFAGNKTCRSVSSASILYKTHTQTII